jgi:nitrilase
MVDKFPKVKVAVVQAAPVLFDREATVEKACRLAGEAAAQGAKVILFPEAFVPAYPRGLTFGTTVGSLYGATDVATYWANAVDVQPSDRSAGRSSRSSKPVDHWVIDGISIQPGHALLRPLLQPCRTAWHLSSPPLSASSRTRRRQHADAVNTGSAR